MLRHVLRGREGQTIVLVAVFMLALLAILALAIDVGHVYAERRRMQNAADAGALAGAREICFGDQGAAALTAQQYAEDNGAESVFDRLRDHLELPEKGGYRMLTSNYSSIG